jgi:hypothetical protein
MTEDIFRSIIKDLVEGRPLDSSLSAHDTGAYEFFKFVNSAPKYLSEYELAQQFKAEVCAEQVVSIADDDTLDGQRARNKIDARRWYSSKMKPAKFGDRVDLNLNLHVDIGAALIDAQQRVRHILDGTQQAQQQVIETTAKQITHATDQQSVDTPLKNELDDILS